MWALLILAGVFCPQCCPLWSGSFLAHARFIDAVFTDVWLRLLHVRHDADSAGTLVAMFGD